METENKKSLGQKIKFGIIAAALIITGLAGGYVLGVFGYIKVIGPYISEMKYKKFLEDYLKPYKEDFVGGNTPEETIDLFIDALKKGDYELAVQYFEVQEQPRWRESFKNPNKENINEWISEIENAKKIWKKEQISDSNFVFKYNTGIGDKERTNFIYTRRNMNNKWKIEGF